MTKKRARVKVKSAAVTRTQVAAEFGRKKARQRRQQWKKRAMLASGGVVLSYVVVTAVWSMATGQFAQRVTRTNEALWQRTADMGFRLDQITLKGRKHADVASIKDALGVEQGGPILAISLADIKAKLEAIPEVKTVAITRHLPNELAITITERTPAAWWQKDGKQQLIDAHGVVLSREKYRQTRGLPVVVGEDAPRHVGELVLLLDSVPSIKPDVVAAVRVGQRRWNIELSREIVVMLPENDPQAAWQRFAGLVEREGLFTKAIRSVDMRVEDRVFIMPAEQHHNPITLTNARDT
jgi:cell division protein FtsQ